MEKNDNRTVPAAVLEPSNIAPAVSAVDTVLAMEPKPWLWTKETAPLTAGRPKSKPVSDALRKILDMPAEELAHWKPATGAQEIAWAQYLEATKGKVKTFAANFITDRVEGKVREDRESHGNIRIVVDIPGPEDD